ncbi:hypothetical protein KIN20_019111, partial [Parelaphostrongylus tenuis]
CQYPNCRRTVTGNVSFMCHLWAHVATWKEYDPNSSAFAMQADDDAACLTPCKRNDVDILSTCPSCAARFHTPYLMQACFLHSVDSVCTPKLTLAMTLIPAHSFYVTLSFPICLSS